MTRDEALAALDEVHAAVHEKFDTEDGLHETRLHQFDAWLATARNSAEALYDEDVRHRHNPRAHAKAIGAYLAEEA